MYIQIISSAAARPSNKNRLLTITLASYIVISLRELKPKLLDFALILECKKYIEDQIIEGLHDGEILWKTFYIRTHTDHHGHKMREQRSRQKEPVTDDSSGARDRDGSSRGLRAVIDWYLLVWPLFAPANSGKMTHLVTAGTDFFIHWAVNAANFMLYSTTSQTYVIPSLFCPWLWVVNSNIISLQSPQGAGSHTVIYITLQETRQNQLLSR